MKNQTTIKIDLHGMKHESAAVNVERIVNGLWGQEVELEIVTGNSEEMKNIVRDALKDYDVEIQDGDYFGVNTGYLKVFLC